MVIFKNLLKDSKTRANLLWYHMWNGAKTLLNRNKKPQNSIMLRALGAKNRMDFDSQVAKNRCGSNMSLNPFSLVFQTLVVNFWQSMKSSGPKLCSIETKNLKTRSFQGSGSQKSINFDSQTAKNRCGSNMSLNPFSLVFQTLVVNFWQSIKSSGPKPRSIETKNLKNRSFQDTYEAYET